MAVNHYKQPMPSGSSAPCRRCKQPATVWVMASRLSRSGNLKRYTVGSYCGKCADDVLVEQKILRRAE